jgi:hypothetical protein
MIYQQPYGVPMAPPARLTIPRSPALRTKERPKMHQCLHANCNHEDHGHNAGTSALHGTAPAPFFHQQKTQPRTTEARKVKSAWEGVAVPLAHTITVPSSPKLRTKERGVMKATMRV